MEDSHKEENVLLERWKDPYILTIKHEDTYADRYSFRLSILKFIGILGAIGFVFGLLTTLIIAFTPVRELIPGYQDIADQRPFLELQRDVQKLEEEVRKRDIYINAFKARLSGHPESEEEAMRQSVPVQKKGGVVPRVNEDSILRAKMAQKGRKVNELEVSSSTGDPPEISSVYFTPPVKGKVSASYMAGKKHYGVDVIAPANTPVLATLPGNVISSDWTVNTGYTIAIQHQNNLVSFYKHNSSLMKRVGDKVRAGEVIAIIGNSGVLTSGPHLHFELWHNGKPIDPEEYIVFD